MRVAVVLLSLVLGSGCAFRHLARTVGEGNGEVRASVGGPFFSNVAPIPLPNLQVGGRYGLTDGFDLDADLSLIGLAYGIVAFDVGAVGQIYREERGFAISASGRGHFLIGTRGPDLRFYPELGVHLEGVATPWLVVFGGLSALAQFTPPEDKPPVFVAPYVGTEFQFGGSDEAGHPHGIVLELGWISPWQDSTSVISYEPGGVGAFLVHLGYRARFGDGEIPR